MGMIESSPFRLRFALGQILLSSHSDGLLSGNHYPGLPCCLKILNEHFSLLAAPCHGCKTAGKAAWCFMSREKAGSRSCLEDLLVWARWLVGCPPG